MTARLHLATAPQAARRAESPIRVVLADDHAAVRRNLRLLLDREEGVEVIAEAADIATVLRHVPAHVPHVLVLDLRMPSGSSIEAIRRLMSPPTVSSGLLIAFGVGALAANACSLLVLRGGRADSLNVRAAFLEVAADTLGAAAVVVTGVIISITGFTLADPIASLVVGALILPRTWRLLKEAIDILLEASPEGIDLAEIRRHMGQLAGVREVHELHAWTITSGLPVLTAHVVVEPDVLTGGQSAVMLDRLQDCLRGHFDVAHSTFQLELAGHAEHEQPMHD